MEGYDFKSHLEEDEKIVWEGRAQSGKGSRNVGGELFLIGFMAIVITLLVWSVVFKVGDGAEGVTLTFIIIMLVCGLFLAIGLWSMLYKLFIKSKAVADDFFCITNKRALKYESKKDELVCGYLVNYKTVECINEHGGYGDLRMMIDPHDEGIDENTLSGIAALKNILAHPNKENMPAIIFESVEHPRKLRKLIYEQQGRKDKNSEEEKNDD